MKNDSKTDRRRLLNLSMRVVVALVMVGLLVVPVAVQAELSATATPFAWDFVRNSFRNSEVLIPWDGTWSPFMEQLPFDAKIFEGVPDPSDPTQTIHACEYDPVTETGGTPWAGVMVYGLAREDTAPVGETGATGFVESRDWSLVSCDRDGDGDGFTVRDRDDPLDPYFVRQPIVDDCETPGGFCQVAGGTDYVLDCTTGNCRTEIVTTLLINLDLDCDGELDTTNPVPGLSPPPLDTRGNLMLCFYAEGRTPFPVEQAWSTYSWTLPLQARLGPVGGDKTVNFKVEQPTAVDLAAFDAAPQGNGVLLTWETASELDNLGFNIYRAESQAGQLVQINQHLIASQNLGGTVGAAYSFLDSSAVPGATYYYWLEDIDLSGATTKHGPVAARTDAAKALPGRPRPAPMPGNAF